MPRPIVSEASAPVALVTGAASGIGAALAKGLHRRGCTVVLADLDEAGAKATAAAIAPDETRARGVGLDVSDADAFQAVVDELFEREGRLDWLCNNAGIGVAGDARDLGVRDWQRSVNVNLGGVIHGIAAAYPRMAEQGFGRILNTASGAALAPRPGMTAYAAAKGGVVALSLSLRAEAAALGVSVSVACPGFVRTGIQKNTRYVGVDGDGLQSLIDKLPMKGLSPEACAEKMIEGARKGRPVVLDSGYVWFDWMLARLSPRAAIALAQVRARAFRAQRTNS